MWLFINSYALHESFIYTVPQCMLTLWHSVFHTKKYSIIRKKNVLVATEASLKVDGNCAVRERALASSPLSSSQWYTTYIRPNNCPV